VVEHFGPGELLHHTEQSMIRHASHPRLFISSSTPDRQVPNKSPEPTTFAVTSRAIVRLIEMKQQDRNRDAARAAPAKVVAHL
jgi:hypothetical protein